MIMKQLYIKIGQDKIFSRLASGTNMPEILRKNDFVYKLHNAELIYIYDEDENKLYTTKIDDKGKYKTPILVDDESIFDFQPANVRFDTTDRKNWKLSTQSRHSDMTTTTYYMSDSNYNVNSGVSWMKISWNGLTELPILYGSYAESYYDYVQVWQMDREITDFSNKSTSSNTSTSQTSTYPLLTTYNKQNSSAPNLSYTFTCDNGEHFVWVSYRKDGSSHSYEDRGYIGIATELLSGYASINVPYYTISKDEYIQENGSYYEKLIYSEDGSSRKGNEYVKQLSETESFITLEDGTYKCNYYVITLYGGKVVNTDEYVLGEKILYSTITLGSGAYFKTDVQPTQDITVEACFKNNSSSERCVFGVADNSSSWWNDGKVFAINVTNSHINAYVSTYKDNVTSCSQNEWHTVSLNWCSVVVDGVNYGNVWNNASYSGYTQNIYIGGMNIGGLSVTNNTTNILTYKYIKIYNNGELIREYVPMIKDGVSCLQEKCNSTFVYKNGDGDVTVE